ncbi:hypothetical protein V2A60_007475 [Cordyceps javanica]|uniref:Glycosyl hydrolase catalytic core domain-containing protein n=1 Tax=Cordyceps javanica TaxID=43265 RepID=A0A545VB40_9HYPO|nr:glycosyl hydrolase catalytic core domain-containing protein [Cordyceps javanica]TQW10039.1 glycosyl hydrolase catalytic core domain-containing protein [Cordyceps javanica]
MMVSQALVVYTLTLAAICSAGSRKAASQITEASTTWKPLGCYTDNVSGRALPYSPVTPGGNSAMTNEGCQNACQSAGYVIAGTEYAGECWCGNAVGGGNGLAPDGDTRCNMTCKGSSAETCGGPDRLTVYQLSSSPPSAGIAKRGLAYNNNNPSKNSVYANMFKGYSKISWAYDWGYPSWGLDEVFEFVPMLWGKPSGAAPDWTAAVQRPGTEHILGFNEPDLTYPASSNMLPADAAAGYQAYMQPFRDRVRVGTPSVLWNNDAGPSSGGRYGSRAWTRYFLGNCSSCHLDFAAIHYYQDCEPAAAAGSSGAAWFRSNVTDAHDALGLPVWVTEFQCYGTEDQQAAFLREVLPWLDAQAYVARYAYFGAFPGFLVSHDGTGLSPLGMVYATT